MIYIKGLGNTFKIFRVYGTATKYSRLVLISPMLSVIGLN